MFMALLSNTYQKELQLSVGVTHRAPDVSKCHLDMLHMADKIQVKDAFCLPRLYQQKLSLEWWKIVIRMHNVAENKQKLQQSIFLCNIVSQLNHKIDLHNFNSY